MQVEHQSSAREVRAGSRAGLKLLVAALVAVAAVGAYMFGALAGLENSSVGERLSLRPAHTPRDVLIVAIDEKTLNAVPHRWPFPRSLDARTIDVLRAAGARTIVYDVQFTEPTSEAQDLSLFESLRRAPGVVLATTEIGPHGETNVLGGAASLHAAHASAAAANFRPNSSGVIQKYDYSIGGLRSIAVVAAEQASGRRVSPRSFSHGSAWIDFPGPTGTVPTVSFSDLIAGRIPRREIAGRLVVVGATAPVLQDIHATSVSGSRPMPGPEVEAAAIDTALHGNRLRDGGGLLALLTILLAAVAAPLACLRWRPTAVLAASILLAVAYTLIAQLAIDSGTVLVLTYPLAALAVGALGMLVVGYATETWEHQLADRYAGRLEQAVRERTAEVTATQRELLTRLAQAAELRDVDTAIHVERVGRMCERLALIAGMSAEDADQLRLASTLHDVGKIGIPDSILLKSGPLTDGEWKLVKQHTRTGAELLAGSRSPLLEMAATVARTHHERWDGSGYPAGLAGEEIPVVGRICAICDVFDALASERPYKRAWPFDEVLAEIARERGKHFDPALVDALLAIAGEFEGAYAAETGLVSDRRCGELLAADMRSPAASVG